MKHHKPLLITSVLVASLIGSVASGQTDVELRGGYYSDAEDGFIGGGLLAGLGNSWSFNPNLEWVLTDGYDYFTVNGDFHYDFNRSSGPAIWAGAGPAMIHTEIDRGPLLDDRSDNDLGMNIFGGIGAKYGSVRPFMQLKGRLADNSETSVALGIRF